MSFVEKNYKNGDTLFANDLNNLVSGIKETKNSIAAKANANDVFTKTEVTEALETKANVADVYTKVEVNNALAEKANVADVYSKAEVDAKVATVFRYCGVVNAISDLPKDNNLVGDAYKVLEDKNVYAWNGTSWDNLGEDVDLTPYLTKEEAAKAYATVDTAANIELQLETKLATADADKKFALKTELPDVSGFATTAVVDEKIKTSETAADEKFALKTAIPNVSDFVTATIVDEKIKTAETAANEKFALKTELPDVSGFAKQAEVDAKFTESTANADKKYVAKSIVIDRVGYTTVNSTGTSVSLNAVDSNKAGKQASVAIDTQSIMQMVNVKDDKVSKKATLINMTVDALEFKRRTEDGKMYSVEVVDLANSIAKVSTLEANIAKKADETAVNAQLSLKANIAVEGDMLVVNSKITELEQKILNLSKTNIVEETISADANYNQPDADLVITGGDQAITEKTDIVAKSISLNQATAENAVLSTTASSGSISIQNFSNSGDLPKSTSNAAVKLNSNDTVIINKSNFSQTGYNSIEIGLNNTAPKSISIDGLDFTAPLSNNAILIFAHAKDAVINISNCHFADVSNALRLSNRLNVPATINIVNCTVDKWDSRDKCAGFLIMEDYTSNTAEDAIAAKRFTNLTINFVNVKGPGGKLIKPDDVASICGTNNAAQQVIYVYHDADDEVKPYSSGLYPKMTFA